MLMIANVADVILVDELPSPVTDQFFWAGNWRKARTCNEQHLSGTVFLSTVDFISAGGYDERFDSYGWEDDDFYARLQRLGLERRNFEPNLLFHLPHSDHVRSACQKDPSISLHKSIVKSRTSAQHRTVWTADDTAARYWIRKCNPKERTCTVREIERQNQFTGRVKNDFEE